MSEEQPADMLARLGSDGFLWAQEFNKTAVRLGYSEMDEGWLIGWFANAIENSCNSLRNECDRLREENARMHKQDEMKWRLLAENTRLREENARLLAALKPFATAANSNIDSNLSLLHAICSLTIEDLSRARAAIREKTVTENMAIINVEKGK